MDSVRNGYRNARLRRDSHVPLLLPHYKIEVEVLWYVAQCITFAGAVFGISAYIKGKFERIEDEINSKINR